MKIIKEGGPVMTTEIREIAHDAELGLEAYRFRGISQPFPNHFHEHYVVGIVEEGRRHVLCMGREHALGAGDLLLLNPLDSHACTQTDGRTLDYRGINISVGAMCRIVGDIYGNAEPPCFAEAVVPGGALLEPLRELHDMLMDGSREPGLEEFFLFTMQQLLDAYSTHFGSALVPALAADAGVEAARRFIEAHYGERITLDRLAGVACLSKYHLIRSFTRRVGISPYAYLEAVRMNAAKERLSRGETPARVAQRTGFSDQSHFTRFFKKIIGLTPAQYAEVFEGKECEKDAE